MTATTVGRVEFEMGLDRTGLRRGLSKAEKEVKRSANAMRNSLAVVGGALVIGGAIRQLAEFEQAMSTVKAVTGATAGEFERMTALAKKMGIETRFSAKQASEGMLALARAGLTVEQTMAALPHTLQLAQAGALDLGDAADIVTNVMSGMQLQVSDLQRVGDVLVKTANSSNTNVQELGVAFSYAAPIAKQFSLSVEDTSAALGLFANNGIKADRGGTALNNVLARLTNRTQKGEKILAKYNLGYDDLDVSVRGLVPVLETLETANLSVADSMALFAIRGSAGGNILAKQRGKFLELAKGARDAGGTMAATSKIMDDNLNGALLRLNSAAQGLVLNLGKDKGLGKVVDALAGALRFAADNADTFGMIAATLALSTLPALASAATAVLAALGPIGAAVAAAGLAATAFIKISESMNKVEGSALSMNEIIAQTNALIGETKSIVDGDPFDLLGSSADEAREKVAGLANTLQTLFINEYTKAAADQKLLIDELEREVEAATEAINKANSRKGREIRDPITGRGLGVYEAGASQEQIDALGEASIKLRREQGRLNQILETGADVINNRLAPAVDEETARREEAAKRLAEQKAAQEALTEAKLAEIEAERLAAIEAEKAKERRSVPEDVNRKQKELVDAGLADRGDPNQKKKEQENEAAEAAEASKDAFRDMFKGAFQTAIIDGDVGSAIKTIFADRAAAGLEEALNNLADVIFDLFKGIDFGGGGGGIGDIFGGAIGNIFGGGKAAGGSVFGNKAYTVGEMGAETFIPFKDGTIIPNKLPTQQPKRGDMSGKGGTVYNTVNIQGDATEATANLINERMKALPGMMDAHMNDRRRRGAF